jgi:hypothetical protein
MPDPDTLAPGKYRRVEIMARIICRLVIPVLLLSIGGCSATDQQEARAQYCSELRATDIRDAKEMERIAYDPDLESGAHYFGGDRLVNKLRGWFIRDAKLLRAKAGNKYNNCLQTGVYN